MTGENGAGIATGGDRLLVTDTRTSRRYEIPIENGADQRISRRRQISYSQR